ncbi:LOW QUALITY PROTEIN: hypothetical protein HID58_020453, partial [Brassica napus]
MVSSAVIECYLRTAPNGFEVDEIGDLSQARNVLRLDEDPSSENGDSSDLIDTLSRWPEVIVQLKRRREALRPLRTVKTAAREHLSSRNLQLSFRAENKNIAGFDNPGKSLYTTVRELVENALDSSESISELPEVEVTIEEIGKSKFNSMIGLIDRERVDTKLYDDYETDKAREKRLVKEARASEIQAKNLASGKKNKEPGVSKARGEASYYKVTCKFYRYCCVPFQSQGLVTVTGLQPYIPSEYKYDNGKGMPHDDIPNMFGRVLSGTKYGLKQTRFNLVQNEYRPPHRDLFIYEKSQNYVTFCRLDIDIHRNIPHIHLHEKKANKEKWHGAEIQVVIEGNWTTYRSKILHYMRQMAVITPYAQFLFRFIQKHPSMISVSLSSCCPVTYIYLKNVTVKFTRRTDVMPPIPIETKHHPSSVDLLLIKRLVTDTSKKTLLQFLQNEFVNINKNLAARLIGEMGPDFSPGMAVKSVTSQQMVRIHQLFRQAKFDDPSGDPGRRIQSSLGIIKELHPDMVATHSGSAQVFEGHPFIVEAGVSVGGRDVKQASHILLCLFMGSTYSFCKPDPLLFEQGGDVVTRTALKRINWNSYKINQTQDKIGVFVSGI